MGLKEELDKIISEEKKKQEGRDDRDKHRRDDIKKRFSVVKGMLEELKNSVSDSYATFYIYDDNARIEIGRLKKERRGRDLTIKIECKVKLVGWKTPEYKLFDGYDVEETNWWIDDVTEEKLEFKNENDLMEYLLKRIGEKIGYYKHLEEK